MNGANPGRRKSGGADGLAGGPETVNRFSRLFGLNRLRLPFQISAVTYRADHFEVTVESDGRELLTLMLEPRTAVGESRPFYATDHIAIWYRGENMPSALETLISRAAVEWTGVTVQRLHRMLLDDPDTTKIAPPEPVAGSDDSTALEQTMPDVPFESGSGPAGTAKGLVGGWDDQDTYADFMAMEVLELLPYEPIEASNPFVRISHSDLECHAFMPPEKPSNMNVAEFLWIDRTKTAADVKAQEIALSTDLTEHSVIMGCNPKASAVLDHVLASNPQHPIIFTNTCLPATTSEDALSVLKRYRKTSPVPIICHNRAAVDSDLDMLGDLLTKRRLKAQEKVTRRHPKTYNLIGFSPGPATDELTTLLLELGLELNAAVLPVIKPEDMDVFPRAAVNVFMRKTTYWDHFYDQLRDGSPIESIFPDPPFGVQGTRKWLATVAEAFGLQSGLETVWEKHFGPLRDNWEERVAAAGRHTISVVVRPRDIACLEDPTRTFGVPLVSVLEEAGFGLECLVQTSADGDADAPQENLDRVAALLAHRRRHTVRAFNGLDEMRKLLKEGASEAVFSNYCFDWRLTEAGKNRVSLKHFAMGLDGALTTVERLLSVCARPFYRRYSKYLKRTARGLLPKDK